MTVVDTDVCAYFWLRNDPDRTRLADQVGRKDPAWAVPPVWVSEFRNVLASAIRFRGMPLDEAQRVASAAEADLLGRIVAVYTPTVLQLVERSGCTAYDCEFVAAAQALGVRLVTGDRALAKAFPGTAVTIEDFCAE
ncbi:MAG: putative nucleic acid-binding protein [Thalassolituus oleivorans]|jgi:predicted nucleic acid-binding protein